MPRARLGRPPTPQALSLRQRLASFDAAARAVDAAAPAATATAWTGAAAAFLAADSHAALRRALCLTGTGYGEPAASTGSSRSTAGPGGGGSPVKAAALLDTASSRPRGDGSPLRRPSPVKAASSAGGAGLRSALKALSSRRARRPDADGDSIPAALSPPRQPRPPSPPAAAAAAAALAAAAPATRGEPLAWLWLLARLADAAGPSADPTPGVAFLARAAKRVTPDAAWLAAAEAALAPALACLRADGARPPPPGLERALAVAAPRAMAAAEDAVRGRHGAGGSRAARADAVAAAGALLSTLTGAAGDAALEAVVAGLAADGAAARYRALASAAAGGASGLAEVAAAAAGDVRDDAETLAAGLPPAAAAALPREAGRVYCARLTADVAAFLARKPAVDAGHVRLVVATHALAAAARPHAPGPARTLAGGGGAPPPFAAPVAAWLAGAGAKLAAWPARALAADGPLPHPAGGARFRASLGDLFAALLALADDWASLAAAHPAYAASLEGALATGVAAHAAALDAAASASLAPRSAAARLAVRARPHEPLAPVALASMSDLREMGKRVDGLAATLRSAVPVNWWGAAPRGAAPPADPSRPPASPTRAMALGDALRVAKADAGRRLDALIEAAAAALAPALRTPLARAVDAAAAAVAADAATATDAATASGEAAALLETAARSALSVVAALADPRVTRAVTRSLWGLLAGAACTRALAGAAPGARVPGLAHRAAGGAATLAALGPALRAAGGLPDDEPPPPDAARAARDLDRFLGDDGGASDASA